MLTQQRANEVFEYRDSNLYWKPRLLSRNRPSVKAGLVAGVDDGRGYLKVGVDKKRYYVHQIVFLMHNGYMPKCVDHADGNVKNNSPENLREASVSQNMFNTKINTKNTSGFKGVHFNKQKQKWQAKLLVRGKQIARVFESFEDAVDFMGLFRELVHGEFANHGKHKGVIA